MNINIEKDWLAIHRHFNLSFRTSFHVSIASIQSDGSPMVTPLGTLFLNSDYSGFYFEKFPLSLRESSENNRSIMVLSVNSGNWFWIKALFRNRFSSYPGIKLKGQLGQRRKATSIELSRMRKRMKTTRFLKGNKYLRNDIV